MFSFFKRSPPPLPCKIWMTAPERDQALLGAITAAAGASQPVVLVCHFQDQLQRWEQQLEQAGLDSGQLQWHDLGRTLATPLLDRPQVYLVISKAVELHSPRSPGDARILVAGIYPSAGRDQALRSLGSQARGGVEIFEALAGETLGRIFPRVDKVIEMMRGMDLKPGEAIEHPLVQKSIIKAQQKVSKQLRSERPADTVDQWFQRNPVSL